MNIILLSGGSGKRLWPLSNETRSKQFLKLLKNEKDEAESMVQRVFRQIQSAGINANIVVATGNCQKDSIQSQLSNTVDIVLEPERRDTFPAIVLASAYLAYSKKMQPSEVVLVLPVDPYADLQYFSTLTKMEQLVFEGAANLVLMGITPTYPSEKYGYIIPKSDGLNVDRFQEKPDKASAEELIKEGALWNGGVFAFQLGYLMNIVKDYIPSATFEDVASRYMNLPKTSFDYEVVEKEKSIAMVEYSGQWRDLGTWNTLTEVMDEYAVGKVILADSCENTHVINELDIPVVALGTKDLVVAASPDGILVSDKGQSSYLKPLVDGIHQMPMYEEHTWGDYQVLDCNEFGDGMRSLTRKIMVKSGHSIGYQTHFLREEIWTIVDGTGDLLVDGHIRKVKRGDIAYISKGQGHAIRAITDMRLIEVQIGIELNESDSEQLDWEWK